MTRTTQGLLHGFVSRGKNRGQLLYPHRHDDGQFVVSKTRFEKDYIRVKDEADLVGWLEKGYKLRMSNPSEGISAPSLIEPGAIYRPIELRR